MYIPSSDTGSFEPAENPGEAALRKETLRHRDMVFAAERSRLCGEPVFTQAALDKRMEALFHAGKG